MSAEYLRTRNEQMRAKALSAQMKLAKERGELISKELDLVGEGHGLLRHSPAQLRGLVYPILLALLGWILIARQREWGYWRKGIVAFAGSRWPSICK